MGSFGSIGFNAVLISTFIASAVEMTEMVIIVVGVGAIRGWRSTLTGAGVGMVILIGIVFGLGQALTLIPIDTVRIIIGALLLTFGLQWYRKGVIGVATDGFAGGEEEEQVDSEAGSGGALDWTAFVLAFKGVLLEGLEIAFIVVAFGAGGGTGSGGTASNSYTSAYIGALAAFILIGAAGLAARGRLEAVPGQTLKFAVGGLLSTFGTYWMLEGLGVRWPSGKYSLAWLYAAYLASTFATMWAVRAGVFGPRPDSGDPDPGPADPSGIAPASLSSIRGFQNQRGLDPDGVVGPRTQAAILAVRRERGESSPDPALLGVDPADETAIRELQKQVGLPGTGAIDAMTRGAVRVLQHPGLIDQADSAAIAAFQGRNDLAVTGRLDERTGAALQAVRTHDPDTQSDPTRTDPVRTANNLDVTDKSSISRFQRSVGLRSNGVLTEETAGALRTLRSLHLVDGLFAGQQSERCSLEPNAVRAFQEQHGLEPSGKIDEPTQQAMRWRHDFYLDVDPIDPESVQAFQRAHDLPPDGVIGSRTQAALRAARSERVAGDDEEAQRRYGPPDMRANGRIVDPADPEQVTSFQRRHGIPETGVVDDRTRSALSAVRRNFPDEPRKTPIGTEAAKKGSLASTLWGWLTSFGRFWYDFIIGDDWVAAAGVGLTLGGVYVIRLLGIVAWWFGPAAILATATYTIRRELFRRSAAEC